MVLGHLQFFAQFETPSHTVTVRSWHLATRLLTMQGHRKRWTGF